MIIHKQKLLIIIHGKMIIMNEKNKSEETIKIKGEIEIDIIDARTKKVIATKHFTNLITNNGLKMYRNISAGVTPLQDPNFNVDTRITHIAVGDDNTTPAASQTALGNELLRKELYPSPDSGCSIDLPANNQVRYNMLIDETELNGEVIRELALFSETFTNFMVSRFLTGNLSKSSSVQFLIKYRLSHS